MSDLTLVCCWVGDKQYAFHDTEVRQIARAEKMRTDATGDGRVGVLDVGGRAAPVFRLGDVLGRGAQRASHSSGNHIAVTGTGNELVGWLVDHIARTSVPQDAHVASLPTVVGPIASSWFESLVWLGTTSVLLMSPRGLNPLQKRRSRPEAPKAPAAGAKKKGGEPSERVVLLFSTPALPSAGSVRFALSGKRIAAITQPIPAIPVPGCAPHVTGVSWWRNVVVPVVDFRGPGDHDDEVERRRCVIAQCGTRLGNTLVAFPVDADIAMHRPDAGDRQVAGTSCPPFISGMFEIGGEVVGLLDLDALLAPVRSDAAEVRDVAMSA
jgi:chemotaxis signal transduction protein